MVTEQELVRDIAVRIPGATEVFRRHKIDFCCNGGVSLADAAARRGVDLGPLKDKLDHLSAGEAPAPVDTDELIDHILERYHEVHARELPEAVRLAKRVEAVHAGHAAAPVGLSDLLEQIWLELMAHQQKEEAILFPMMRAGGAPMIRGPIARMMAEHEEVGEQLAELAAITTDFSPPQGACTTWRALYQLCQKLDEDLREHMHLENNILFPRFV